MYVLRVEVDDSIKNVYRISVLGPECRSFDKRCSPTTLLLDETELNDLRRLLPVADVADFDSTDHIFEDDNKMKSLVSIIIFKVRNEIYCVHRSCSFREQAGEIYKRGCVFQ